MTWGFLWLMLVLKIPIIGLFWIIWWAVRQNEPEIEGGDGGGGSKVPVPGRRPRWPRSRGPHGDPAPVAPARVRTTVLRGRKVQRP